MTPEIFYISEKEFNESPDIYKIISHDRNNIFAYFEVNGQRYYMAWFSSGIQVEFLYIESHHFLLIGVDLQVAAISLSVERIMFSMGTFSFFKYFEDKNELSFTIYTELADIIINKNGFSISQIISHDLEF